MVIFDCRVWLKISACHQSCNGHIWVEFPWNLVTIWPQFDHKFGHKFITNLPQISQFYHKIDGTSNSNTHQRISSMTIPFFPRYHMPDANSQKDKYIPQNHYNSYRHLICCCFRVFIDCLCFVKLDRTRLSYHLIISGTAVICMAQTGNTCVAHRGFHGCCLDKSVSQVSHKKKESLAPLSIVNDSFF